MCQKVCQPSAKPKAPEDSCIPALDGSIAPVFFWVRWMFLISFLGLRDKTQSLSLVGSGLGGPTACLHIADYLT